MFVSEVMTENVHCMAPEDTVQDAITKMQQEGISCVPVVSDKGILGIVTERDVVARFLVLGDPELKDFKNLLGTPLAQLEFRPPVSVQGDTSLQEALLITRRESIRRLLITDAAGELVGLVTQTSLARAYETILEYQQELEEKNQVLNELSYIDDLMQIGNRRAMEEDLELASALYDRYGQRFAIALIDVDHFKPYNDIYGHLAGDVALNKIATTLKGCVRATDKLYRYGGEEMLLVIHDSDQCDVAVLAEKLRAAVEAMAIPHEAADAGVVSVSIGLAISMDTDWKKITEVADKVLYQAKAGGRNRVVIDESWRDDQQQAAGM